MTRLDDIIYTLLKADLPEVAEGLSHLKALVETEPTFRDYTGTDYQTCGYCHEPVEHPDQQHADNCSWLAAARWAGVVDE